MEPFYENLLQEQQLLFSFPDARGATRYELWDSHIARIGKKAVDFIYPTEEKLFFTEVKDFLTITRQGRFGEGIYTIALAENIEQKVKDTFSGIEAVDENNSHAEQEFVNQTKNYDRYIVFHWEFSPLISEQKRKDSMMLMKQKLRQLLNGTCSRIRIENMADNPSKIWSVSRPLP